MVYKKNKRIEATSCQVVVVYKENEMMNQNRLGLPSEIRMFHYDVINWKRFPRYWPFVSGIHRSPMDSPHKGQWRGDLMFSLICAWTFEQIIETPVIWDVIALIIMTSL